MPHVDSPRRWMSWDEWRRECHPEPITEFGIVESVRFIEQGTCQELHGHTGSCYSNSYGGQQMQIKLVRPNGVPTVMSFPDGWRVDRRVASVQRRAPGGGDYLRGRRRSLGGTARGRRSGDKDAHRNRRIINTLIHLGRRRTDKPVDRRKNSWGYASSQDPRIRALERRRDELNRTWSATAHAACRVAMDDTTAKVAHDVMTAEDADVAARVAGLRDYAAAFGTKATRS